MKTLHTLYYKVVDGGDVILGEDTEIYSDYVLTLFENGSLFRNVHLNDDGWFALDFYLDDDTGDFEVVSKFKHIGWCEVKI